MRFLPLGCALLALAGCGSTDNSVTVSGTVSIGAVPLANGVIRFTPPPNAGVPVASTVAGGKYSAQVPPGKYTVTVEASAAPSGEHATSDKSKGNAAPLPAIPEKYRKGVPTEIAGPNPALDFDLSK